MVIPADILDPVSLALFRKSFNASLDVAIKIGSPYDPHIKDILEGLALLGIAPYVSLHDRGLTLHDIKRLSPESPD